MKDLTKAEEQVMQYLWHLKTGYLKDVVEQFPDPKPAYTTVSTVIRVLVRKGFLDYKTHGKANEYFPKVSKDKYFKAHFKHVVHNFFSGSTSNFTSFFTENEDLKLNELEEMKSMIEKKINDLKTKND